MNILFLAHRIPYPPNKGDKIRSFHEIKYLSREHNLYLAFLVDDERDLQYLDELKQYCVTLDYDVINSKQQKLKALLYLATGMPLSVPYFYSARLQGAVDKLLESAQIDVIFCFSSPMAEYVFRSRHYDGVRCANARLIMDFVDVDSDKWRLYAEFSGFPYSTVYRREWKRLQEYEKRLGGAFDGSIFVSDKEAELFRSFCPNARPAVVPNGVDLDYFGNLDSFRNMEKGGPTILFTGAMDYFPNEDAVIHFAGDIWPLVKEKQPDARFFVVGSKPGKRVKSLSEKDPDIVVTGYVPDVRPYLAMADVFVAPFRIARGVQNKVLEAMAAGVPVVARPEAVQGIAGVAQCAMIERNCEEFARGILKLLSSQESRELIQNAYHFVQRTANWVNNIEKLNKALKSTY